MWDFSIGGTLGLLLRTWPFVLLRLAIYFAISMGYVLAVGTGAGVGYGVGHIFGREGGPLAFSFWGGVLGFGGVSLALYWLREYLLYMVKAGHIAVMAHLIDGRPVPDGQSQIAYARAEVTARFKEANILFALDQLIKAVIVTIGRLLGGIAAFLPIPGLQGLVRFANTVMRLSLTYVDEIILGYNIRRASGAPFDTAREGLVLYAQNGMRMVKNAVWLAVFLWLVTIVVFVFMLAPAAAILYYMPGQLAGWSFVLAIVFAWALRAAVLEPFAVAALMSVYFRAIEGQTPDPRWEHRLTEASRQFREMGESAMQGFGFGRSSPA